MIVRDSYLIQISPPSRNLLCQLWLTIGGHRHYAANCSSLLSVTSSIHPLHQRSLVFGGVGGGLDQERGPGYHGTFISVVLGLLESLTWDVAPEDTSSSSEIKMIIQLQVVFSVSIKRCGSLSFRFRLPRLEYGPSSQRYCLSGFGSGCPASDSSRPVRDTACLAL